MHQTSSPQSGNLWTLGYIALLFVNLLHCLGFYMLPATLPAYVKEIGGTNFQASLVIGAFSIMSLVSRVVSGTAVDAFGERKVIFAGMIAVSATTLSFIVLPVNGILLLRSLQGFGWGVSSAAIATAVFKVVPPARRGEGSGYYALTVISALSLTPIAAILLMKTYDFIAVLGVSASLSFAAILLLSQGLSSLPPVDKAHRAYRKVSLQTIFEKGALLPSLLCFILTLPLCGVMVYLVLFGNEQGIDSIWMFFIGYTLMIMVTRPFIGRLFDRRGHAVIIITGAISMMIGLVALSLTDSTTMLIVASLFSGLGYGAVHPSLQAWAVNRCPPDRKAAANGLFMSAIDLGYLVGAVILGHIAGLAGYAMMYRYSALAMLAFLAVYVLELRRHSAAKA